ncbi:MAG: hypothetical protein QOI15_2145 [Pseudonocardiales bacterium]|nr:hypothetical protein [Pseudonocardiales bacterium]
MIAPSRSRGRRRAIGLTAAAAAVGTVVVAASAWATTPPWQVPGDANNDPNRVGSLSFYNAAGTEIFSGDVAVPPFAAYVKGSAVLRTGDTKAALYAYLPNPAKPAGAWTGSLLTAASTYPNGSAPGALAAAAPLQTGAVADGGLAGFISGHPNQSAVAGYQGVYELRLRTSGPGRAQTATYDAADIQVTGTTWQVVYPAHFTDTTTTLELAPNSGLHVGDPVTLTATVSPSAATGTVHFTDGATALGADVAVSGGVATKTFTLATAGSHTFHATFVPTGGSEYAGSAGQVTASVAKASSTTTATWPTGPLHYGTKFTVKATVSATGTTPTGTVALKSGTTTLASANLAAGKATLTVAGTALAPGSRPVTLVYAGSAGVLGSQAATTLTIAKAVAKATNTLSSASVRKTEHAKVTVKVTAPGTTPTGKVSIFDGSKVIATGTLRSGSVTITLPTLAVGKHSIHAKYLGSALVAAASGPNVVLTVTR